MNEEEKVHERNYGRIWEYVSCGQRITFVFRNDECGYVVEKRSVDADDSGMVVWRCVRVKEIMTQYGQTVIAIVIAALLFSIIGMGTGNGAHGIYAQTGQTLENQNTATTSDNVEFEHYWRIR